MIVSMSIVAFTILIVDSLFIIPEELSALLYFLSIGVAISSVFNYYKN